MLIFGKGKCFHGVWLHFKKFSGKYFLVFGKEEGKHKSEKHKPQIQNNTSKLRLVHSNIFTKNASNQAKETKTQQKKMNQRRATTGAMSDERRAVPSSIDERACQTRTAHRSRRSSIDERCDRPDNRARRSRPSSVRCDRPTSGAIDDRDHAARRSTSDACPTSALVDRATWSTIALRDLIDRAARSTIVPHDLVDRDRRSRRSSARCDHRTSGAIWALSSLSLSLWSGLSLLSLSFSLFPEMIWRENEGAKSFSGQRWKCWSTGSHFPENIIFRDSQTCKFGGKWFPEIIFTQNKRTLNLFYSHTFFFFFHFLSFHFSTIPTKRTLKLNTSQLIEIYGNWVWIIRFTLSGCGVTSEVVAK